MSLISYSQQWLCSDIDDFYKAADEIFFLLKPGRILLEGDLGAGKTTLVQSLCRKIAGVQDASSPTYSLMHLYAHGLIAHLDLYRIRKKEELELLGLDELDSKWLFIEWGQSFEKELAPITALINLSLLPTGLRLITLSLYES